MIKTASENCDFMICLTKLFNKIFSTGTHPDNWCIKDTSPICIKKGSVFEPENYRGITIMNTMGKLFNSTLNIWLQTYLEKHQHISPLQIGFQQNSSTNIFTLNTAIEKYTQNDSQKLYACFIDFRQAFDRIWHQGLLLKLVITGINNLFFNIV